MIQVYKIVNWYENFDMECFFMVYSDSYTHGHPFKLKKLRGNMVRYIAKLSHCTVNDWNGLT